MLLDDEQAGLLDAERRLLGDGLEQALLALAERAGGSGVEAGDADGSSGDDEAGVDARAQAFLNHPFAVEDAVVVPQVL